ncbi:hypothetical protein VTJ04DRAFT_573 [Mycothermus thermophilus]|uniref:uncharacterized protein n=1 Tax=Humicola insolens TaxID=85995 RepID=UPI0037423F87
MQPWSPNFALCVHVWRLLFDIVTVLSIGRGSLLTAYRRFEGFAQSVSQRRSLTSRWLPLIPHTHHASPSLYAATSVSYIPLTHAFDYYPFHLRMPSATRRGGRIPGKRISAECQ